MAINTRQEEVKKGLYPPLILYPEGGTTNNTELLKFKGGAFRGLHSVQPITLKYYSPYMTPSHDVMNVFSHILLMCCQPFTIITVQELPVFEPNDYFFKHHMQEGEIKWVTYMRVIREIMADAL